MRKRNSDFKTAFVSEAGSQIENSDYLGFVELDDLAIYVVADGIHSNADSESAKKAIQSIVLAFHAKPSMKKSALRSYLKQANRELLAAGHRHKLKASVMIVVTDYVKMRYACAGNTRLHLYRGSTAIERSRDMSLSQDWADRDIIHTDKLAQHEERNNLYAYLGQADGFRPFISKKFKLLDSDILAIFTRGIWENLDDGELFDVFSEATDEPQESVDTAEELLLSKQPPDLANYTLAAIFANKIYTDPKRARKIKRIITISIIVFVILLIVGLVVFFWLRDRRDKRENMNAYFDSAIAYIQDNNYPRAGEDAKEAYTLATKLRDREKQAEINRYIRLIESVNSADEHLSGSNYQEAQDAYRIARDNSREADNNGLAHIESGLSRTESYISYYETMTQADNLLDRENYVQAIAAYTEARRIASALYFTEGKQLALAGIEKAYDGIAKADAESREQAQAYADQVLAATELVAQGDASYDEGDYETALLHYTLAREKYGSVDDNEGYAVAETKMALANQKIGEADGIAALAGSYIATAEDAYDNELYATARHYYNLARLLYIDLSMSDRISEMETRMEACNLAAEAAAEAAAAAEEAKNRSILSED